MDCMIDLRLGLGLTVRVAVGLGLGLPHLSDLHVTVVDNKLSENGR